MQDAEVVLDVLRERGGKGLPLTQLYRQMFNKNLYLLAYGNIYSNQGAMTPGASGETADGMSEGMIDEIIELMRFERYRFAPARRVYIPKKNGKLRPLGVTVVAGQARRRGGPPDPRGDLRAVVLVPVARVPERTRVSYRIAGDPRYLDRDRVVHRGRHLRLLRVRRPRDPDADTGGEDR